MPRDHRTLHLRYRPGDLRVTPSGQQTVLHTFGPRTRSRSRRGHPGDGGIYGATRGGPSTIHSAPLSTACPAYFPPGAAVRSLRRAGRRADRVPGRSPVTGWALDDTLVNAVDIYRSPVAGEPADANGLVRLGPATFVEEGARPDVAAIYATHPFKTRAAGAPIMLLSNMLPGGSRFTFTLTAITPSMTGTPDDTGAEGDHRRQQFEAFLRDNGRAGPGCGGQRRDRQLRLGADAKAIEMIPPTDRQSPSMRRGRRRTFRPTICSGRHPRRCFPAMRTATARSATSVLTPGRDRCPHADVGSSSTTTATHKGSATATSV